MFGYNDVLLEATNGYFGDLFYPGVQFGYFLPQNQTSPEIIISTDTIDDFGTVKYFEGRQEVPFWPDNKDQQIRGTNGLTFSPLRNSTELFVFDPFLCKSVKFDQEESEQSFITDNIKFILDLEAEQLDISKCINMKFHSEAPIVISKPRSLDSYLKLDPITGIVYKKVTRFQVNLATDSTLPILWFEEKVSLKRNVKRRIYWSTVLPIASLNYITRYFYLGAIISFLFGIAGVLWPRKTDRLPGKAKSADQKFDTQLQMITIFTIKYTIPTTILTRVC